MADENTYELHGLHAEAAGLQQMIEKVNSQVPSRVDGFDPSGAVSVVVGPDGLPAEIHVSDDWTFRLMAERLADAVMGAFTAAFYERLRAWTTAYDVEDLDDLPAADEQLDLPGVEEPPAPATTPAVKPRDPEAYALAVLEALDDVGEVSEAPAGACGVGVIDGCLELTLTGAGLISCFVEPDWAAHCSGEELTAAFNATLAAAHDDLAAAAAASPSGRLRQLLDEGFAILNEAGSRSLIPTTLAEWNQELSPEETP
jgi:hypothetical protein